MQDFPGNSSRAQAQPGGPPPPKQEEADAPKVERITTAQAVQRKHGLGTRLKETFIGGSARDTVDYMVVDVVVPAIRDTIVDALQGGIERLFNGEGSRPRRPTTASSAYSNVPRIDYSRISRPPEPPQSHRTVRRSRSAHGFGDIIIDSRSEAADVIEQMYEYLSRFGEVKLSDLYTMTGLPSSHVDQRWGWTSLKGARYVRTRDNRFLLNLPEPIALD